MARVFVLGHGVRRWGEAVTWAPSTMTVHFNADFDHYLWAAIGLEVLATQGASGSVQQYRGRSLPNYELYADSDEHMAHEMQALRPETHAVWIGDAVPSPIRLCTGSSTTCPRNGDRHHCSGLLAILGDYDEVFLLVCRAPERGRESLTTYHLPNEDPKARPYATDLEARESLILELARTDPQAANDVFDSYSPLDQAKLLSTSEDIGEWWAVRNALAYRRENSGLAFYRYFLSRSEDERAILEDHPRIAHWIHQSHAMWRDFRWLLASDPARAGQTWNEFDATTQVDLQAVDRMLGSSTLSTYSFATHRVVLDFVPSDEHWAMLDRHNAEVLYGSQAQGRAEVRFVLADHGLLFGADEEFWELANYLVHRPGVVEGTAALVKAPTSNAATRGLLEVSGVDRDLFEAAIDRMNATGVFEATVVWKD